MHNKQWYGRGKLLLTSEYFVLDGAVAIALPTKLGQHLQVQPSDENGILHWQSHDHNGNIWLSAQFELGSLNVVQQQGTPCDILQSILRAATKLNPAFLASDSALKVTTKLEFDKSWGLGSSSTLLYMIAQWAQVSAFDLAEMTIGGSGYDIACAGTNQPILYQRQQNTPSWHSIDFNPAFKDQLFLIYLNQKQDTRAAIQHYRQQKVDLDAKLSSLDEIVTTMLHTSDLTEFEQQLEQHEQLVAKQIKVKPVQQRLFSDYWGKVKSLGAWGGDFVLATSNRNQQETLAYFKQRGFNTVLNYQQLVN